MIFDLYFKISLDLKSLYRVDIKLKYLVSIQIICIQNYSTIQGLLEF